MKKLLLLVCVLGIALLALFIGRHYYHEWEKAKALLIIETIKKEGQYLFATGRLGDYPVLICSYDYGRTWQYQTVRKEGVFPPQSSYRLQTTGETVCIHEYQPCIECDSSNKLLGIYYSHNSGKNWQSVHDTHHFSKDDFLVFHNQQEGEIREHINEKETYYFHTKDGGQTWIEGKLSPPRKSVKKATSTIRSRMSKSNSNEYLIEHKVNREWTYLSRIDRLYQRE